MVNMSTPIAENVEKLRASTTLLNQAGDELSTIVRNVEAFLDECGVGVHAEVMVFESEDERGQPEFCTNLGYSRIGGKFRIVVSEMYYSSPESPYEKPWTYCSRQEKIMSAKKLPDLISSIIKQVEAKTTETREVAAKLAQELKPILKPGKAAK